MLKWIERTGNYEPAWAEVVPEDEQKITNSKQKQQCEKKEKSVE